MQAEPQSRIPEISMMAESRALQSFAAVAGVIALISIVFLPTTATLVATWARSATFTHAFLVVPATLWFVWTSRWRLAATEIKPWWPGLVLLGGAGFAWLAGELAHALAVTQWAVVLMVPLTVLTLFGWGWLRTLAFPMMFLFFTVPFGDAFVPSLIDWTADFTVAALAASGVPVFREGAHFVIPSGRWSVVEACSGIRYLVASLVVGVLYAWTMYRSPLRRGVFIAASILVPLVANWIRAYLIVMIGHLTDNRLAAGVDHLVYGWVFFGVVIALLFWVGARWREDDTASTTAAPDLGVPTTDASVLSRRLTPSSMRLIVTAVVISAWPVARDALLASEDKRPVRPVPVVANDRWPGLPVKTSGWRPLLEGPAQTGVHAFSRDGSTVTLYVGYYRNQKQGAELVSSMNRLVPEDASQWEQIARGRAEADFGAERTSVHAATIRRSDVRLRVWHWYWIDGRIVASDTLAKLHLVLDRLRARSDTSMWVAVYTAAESDAMADQVLLAFLRDMGPAVEAALAATAAR